VPRAAAARAVAAVLAGQSLTAALAEEQERVAPRDQGLLQELSYGTVRALPRLRALRDLLVHRPLAPREQDIAALLLVGLYQLDALRLPAHAAVAATVGAARTLGKPWACGLLNASLRRFGRDATTLRARAEENPEARWLFPDWLLTQLRAAWPDQWPALVAASNERAPMFLRVNPLRITRAAYLDHLVSANIAATPVGEQGLRLARPLPTAQLPGYAAGWVSVQDLGAQVAALALAAQPGQRVLDACAAPGGKSAHVLERAGGHLALTALDRDAQRLATLRANLQRLGLRATTVHADATQPAGAWAQERYARILLDAPCSGTGAIRRHPDIKWLRRASDIAALAATQDRLLDALWPLLADDGRLLYVTCSLLPEENEARIAAFLARHPEARALPLDSAWGLSRPPGRQLLPTVDGGDGFFLASLARHNGG